LDLAGRWYQPISEASSFDEPAISAATACRRGPPVSSLYPFGPDTVYQAVEKRDLLCCASSFVIKAYGFYTSFLRIRAPCI